jgi:hypothetical protein
MKVFLSSTYLDLIEHRKAAPTLLSFRRGVGDEVPWPQKNLSPYSLLF